ncbi:MAG TPA: DMT family transporter [Actinomycetota bacterium]|nr:DMT family transporter [Actinomycetota bacterium]
MAMGAAAIEARRAAFRANPGPAALLLAMLIWGGTLVVTKSLLEGLGPATLLSVRFLVAFLCLAPFAYRAGFRLRDLVRREFVLFGLTGIVLHNGLETWGLRYTSPGSAALIIAGIPAVTVALSRVFLREALPRSRAVGVALSVVGVALVTRPTGVGALELAGNLLVFGGVVAWGVYTIQGKKMSVRVPAIVGTTAGTGAALLFLLPAAVVESWGEGIPAIGMADVTGLLYLGLGASAAAYALWNFALEHVDASVAAPYVNLVPIIGLALAMMLGESMTALDLAGGATVAAGVWLSTSRRFAPIPAAA